MEPLGFHPFEPISNNLKNYKASDLKWNFSNDMDVAFLPGVGSFIGSDILMGAWVKNMAESEKLKVLVDLGTNGEILVGNKEKILAASTAAGPALKGWNFHGNAGGIRCCLFCLGQKREDGAKSTGANRAERDLW